MFQKRSLWCSGHSLYHTISHILLCEIWVSLFHFLLYFLLNFLLKFFYKYLITAFFLVVSGKPIACCRSNGYSLPPREQHPDCAPISVPENDPFYSEHRIRCLDYVRSLPVLRPECNFGPAEQVSYHHFNKFLIFKNWFVLLNNVYLV